MYMCYSHLVSSSYTGMTDAERDAIDNEAQQYMKVCTDAIRQLKDNGLYHINSLYLIMCIVVLQCVVFITDIDAENLSTQAEKHREEVQTLLQTFLKGIEYLLTEASIKS